MKRGWIGIIILFIMILGCVSFDNVEAGNGIISDLIDINEQCFPDKTFRQFIQENVDRNMDNKLSKEERDALLSIELDGDVESIEGIEWFEQLQSIKVNWLYGCKNQELVFQGLKQLQQLKLMIVSNVNVESIVIKDCPGLEELEIESEGISHEFKMVTIDHCENLKKMNFICMLIDKVAISDVPKLEKGRFFYECTLGLVDLRNCNSNILPEYFSTWSESWYDGDKYVILINSDNDVVDGWYTFRDGKKTYIDSDLNPARGIIRIDGVLYGFHPVIGLLVTGWNEINGTWYLMDDNGKVQTGWQKWKGKWYLLGEDGAMKTRWQLVDGKWYFMRDNGMMLRSEYIQGYWLNKDGSCTYKPVAGWKKDSTGVYYQDTSGYYVRNTTVIIDRKKYTFDKHGYLVE